MEKEIDFLKDNLNYIFGLWLVFNQLRTTYLDTLAPPLDKVFISSVARSYILGLAALVDASEDSKGNKNITINFLKNIDLKPHQTTIEKIRKIRHKIIAHNDSESNKDGDLFVKGVNLTHEESEGLMNYLLSCIENHRGETLPRKGIKQNYMSALRQTFGH